MTFEQIETFDYIIGVNQPWPMLSFRASMLANGNVLIGYPDYDDDQVRMITPAGQYIIEPKRPLYTTPYRWVP
jgi:hypothetical protein